MGRHSSRINRSFQTFFSEIPTNKFKKMKKGYLERISGIIVSAVQ